MSFTGTITIDDKELVALIERLASGLPDGVIGRVFSKGAIQRGRRYEHYVMSADRQAAVHRGRWQTEKSIAEDNEPKAVRIFERNIGQIVGGSAANLRVGVSDLLEQIYKDATDYPPERPAQVYIRTGTLGASWAKENNI